MATRHWQIQRVDFPNDCLTAVEAFADGAEVAWLDGVDYDDAWLDGVEYEDPSAGRNSHSLIATAPIAVIEQYDRHEATLSVAGRVVRRDANGWRLWRTVAKSLPAFPALPRGMAPGWVGYLGFEMARQLERLPASHVEDLGLPLMRMALHDRAVVLDHHEQTARAIVAPGVREALDLAPLPAAALIERWRDASATASRCSEDAPTSIQPEISSRDHARMVSRALEYIAAGDIYQVNLAQRFLIDGLGDSFHVFARVRSGNPAPHAALIRWDDGAIISASPELFLELRNGRVLTRPIKGTRPHTGDALLDNAYREQLLNSEKDAAELAMIVDLHRNDLGRVCAYGSVRVRHARLIETHPTVFHTVAEIEGRLAKHRDAFDLLEAAFPAGSISGAPKIRAMQIIDELEPAARGAYTGSIGVVGLDGSLTMNVAIRTLQQRGSRATLYVGGGIVADSDPREEYDETLAKARGILESLRAGDRTINAATGDARA